MIIVIVTITGIAILFLIWFGYMIATTQNNAINRCFELRKLHKAVLFGEKKLKEVSKSDLISLSKPMFTHVGMGGVGPSYFPSHQVFDIVNEEMSRRRNEQA